jgi:hypothetical protein
LRLLVDAVCNLSGSQVGQSLGRFVIEALGFAHPFTNGVRHAMMHEATPEHALKAVR